MFLADLQIKIVIFDMSICYLPVAAYANLALIS